MWKAYNKAEKLEKNYWKCAANDNKWRNIERFSDKTKLLIYMACRALLNLLP